MERTNENLKDMESSASGDSVKGSCSDAPQIVAPGRDPVEQGAGETSLIGGGGRPSPSNLCSENLEGLTEKFDTLGLRTTSNNRCGAAKKRARRARLAEDPSGDSGGGQTRSAPGGKPQTLQKPYTSVVQRGKSTESRGLPPCPNKRQRSAGGTPERGGGTERPKQFGQLGYARVDREGLRVAVVCENYPESQISKENFTDFRWAIGRHMDELPEDGFTHRLVDSYWAEGRLLWSATTKDQGLVGCQGTYPRGLCRLQAHVSGPGCSSHLQEGGGLFPGHAEDAERY